MHRVRTGLTEAQRLLAEASQRALSVREWAGYDVRHGGRRASEIKLNHIDRLNVSIMLLNRQLDRLRPDLEHLELDAPGPVPEIRFHSFLDVMLDSLITDVVTLRRVRRSADAVEDTARRLVRVVSELDRREHRDAR